MKRSKNATIDIYREGKFWAKMQQVNRCVTDEEKKESAKYSEQYTFVRFMAEGFSMPQFDWTYIERTHSISQSDFFKVLDWNMQLVLKT